MITKQEIDEFINKIPPSPKILVECIKYLNIGELTKAAKVAEGDLALKSYLKHIVNKPIYGFKNEVSDIAQIFAIFGVCMSQQVVYNYMISLLSPNKWELFKLNKRLFYELQAQLSKKWEIILKYLNIQDAQIYSAITLLPSSIIVTEALFCNKKDEILLLRTTKNLDYNTILKRLCGFDIFDICQEIAKKWDMGEKIAKITQASSGIKPSNDKNINELGKWMHLLLFYELSQSQFIEAGLNDFIDFNVEYVSDIYEKFASLMEIKE